MWKEAFLMLIASLLMVFFIDMAISQGETPTEEKQIIERGVNWDKESIGNNQYKTTYYMGAVNIPDEQGNYVPVEEFINVTIQNGNVVISRGDNYSVSFMPIFEMINGHQYYWGDIPPSIEKNLWKEQYRGKYKYGADFYNISNGIKNNLRYIILHRTASTGLAWDDIQIQDSSIIVKDKIKLSHDDILNTYAIPLINKTDIVIEVQDSNFIDNGDGTWNISLDPTVTYNFNAPYEGINSFAYKCDASSDVVPNDSIRPQCSRNITSITSGTGLDSSDDVRNYSGGEVSGAQLWQIFEFNTSITLSDISLVNFTWEGRVNAQSAAFYIYIWNVTNISWILLYNTTNLGFVDVVKSYARDDINDIFDSSNLIEYIVFSDVAAGRYDNLETDFVQLEITYTLDTTPPTFTNNISNSPITNDTVAEINTTWTDNTAMSEAWCEANFTGTFVNTSAINITSKYYCNYSEGITAGVYEWRQIANDTSNNINDSMTFTSFTITEAAADACIPTIDQNWLISTAITCTNYEITTGTGLTNITTGGLLTLVDSNLTSTNFIVSTTDSDVIVLNISWSTSDYYINLTE